MNTIKTALLIFLLSAHALQAQPQNQTIDFSGNWQSVASGLLPTQDGGFLLTGSIGNNSDATQGDVALVKLNSRLQPEWGSRYASFQPKPIWCQYSIPRLEYGTRSVETPDGFVTAGCHDRTEAAFPFCGRGNYALTADFDVLVIKTDKQGRLQWANTYGVPGSGEVAYDIRATRDGGFLLSGIRNTGAGILTGSRPFILRLDSRGQVLWSKVQEAFNDQATLAPFFAVPSRRMPAIELQNGDIAYVASNGNESWLIRLTAAGQNRWTRRLYHSGPNGLSGDLDQQWALGALSGGWFCDLLELPDGRIALLGNTVFGAAFVANPQGGIWIYLSVGVLAETDSLGNALRTSAFTHNTGHGGVVFDMAASDFEYLPNGHYLISGISESYTWIMDYDPSATAPGAHAQWIKNTGMQYHGNIPYNHDFPSCTRVGNEAFMLAENFRFARSPLNADTSACHSSMEVLSLNLTPGVFFSDTASLRDAGIVARGQAFSVTPLDSLRLNNVQLCGPVSNDVPAPGGALQARAYPNPWTAGSLRIELQTQQAERLQFSLLNLQGQEVWRQQLQVGAGSHTLECGAKLPPGLYIASLRGNSLNWQAKITRY